MVKLKRQIITTGMVFCFLLMVASGVPAAEVSGKIDINTASVEQLAELKGIGPAIAGRIIDYREANGEFQSIGELVNVRGIGPKTFENIKDRITAGR